MSETWWRLQPKPLENASESLPEQLDLQAINEAWKINYQASDRASLGVKTCEAQQFITISGPIQDSLKVKQALQKMVT